MSFALEYFRRIHSEIKLRELKNQFLEDHKDDILSELLRFVLAVSIEYREGRVSFSDSSDIDGTSFGVWFPEDGESEKDKSAGRKFIEKYFSGAVVYHYYKSVFQFLTGGKMLALGELEKELLERYNIKEDESKMSDAYKTLNSLGFQNWQCFKLGDGDYRRLTYKLKASALAGEFALKDYVTAFYFLIRFNNPFAFDIKRLLANFISTVNKNIRKFQHVPLLQMHLTLPSDIQGEDADAMRQMIKSILAVNKKLEERNRREEDSTIEGRFYENVFEFTEDVLYSKEELRFRPMLQHFNPQRFYSFFMKAPNETKNLILQFIHARYKIGYNGFADERHFLAAVLEKIETRLASIKTRGLSHYLITEMRDNLTQAIASLPAS